MIENNTPINTLVNFFKINKYTHFSLVSAVALCLVHFIGPCVFTVHPHCHSPFFSKAEEHSVIDVVYRSWSQATMLHWHLRVEGKRSCFQDVCTCVKRWGGPHCVGQIDPQIYNSPVCLSEGLATCFQFFWEKSPEVGDWIKWRSPFQFWEMRHHFLEQLPRFPFLHADCYRDAHFLLFC